MARRPAFGWPSAKSLAGFGSLAIDWTHPLAAGLEICLVFHERRSVVQDLVNRRPARVLGAEAWLDDALDFNGTSTYLNLGVHGTGGGGSSVAVGICVDAFQAVNPWISGILYGTGTTFFYLRLGTGAAEAGQDNVYFANFGAAVTGTTNLAAGRWYHLAATSDSGIGPRVYVDGELDGSGAAGAVAPATRTYYVSQEAGGRYLDGRLRYLYLWNRTLGAAEVRWLAAEPYAFIQPALRHRGYGLPLVLSTITRADSGRIGQSETWAGLATVDLTAEVLRLGQADDWRAAVLAETGETAALSLTDGTLGPTEQQLALCADLEALPLVEAAALMATVSVKERHSRA